MKTQISVCHHKYFTRVWKIQMCAGNLENSLSFRFPSSAFPTVDHMACIVIFPKFTWPHDYFIASLPKSLQFFAGKALLHMWAQYRFGVHSEHGYVGDSMFPYAFRNPNRQLTVTGCSNANVKGKFVDL